MIQQSLNFILSDSSDLHLAAYNLSNTNYHSFIQETPNFTISDSSGMQFDVYILENHHDIHFTNHRENHLTNHLHNHLTNHHDSPLTNHLTNQHDSHLTNHFTSHHENHLTNQNHPNKHLKNQQDNFFFQHDLNIIYLNRNKHCCNNKTLTTSLSNLNETDSNESFKRTKCSSLRKLHSMNNSMSTSFCKINNNNLIIPTSILKHSSSVDLTLS